MKKNNFSEMITSVDVLNTLNGGVTEPHIEFEHHDDRDEIHVFVPGIRKDNIFIEIDKNVLTVFYTIFIQSAKLLIPMPRVVYSKEIPYFIKITKISAQAKGEGLVITMPFNRLADGYYRNIKVDEV